jgi:hypothetical protein
LINPCENSEEAEEKKEEEENAYTRWRKSLCRRDLVLSWFPFINRYRSRRSFPYCYNYTFDFAHLAFNWLVLSIVFGMLWPYLRILFADLSTHKPAVTFTPVPVVKPVGQPITPTPMIATPTLPHTPPTPTPTPTPSVAPRHAVVLGYSYYWPPLGGANCHPDNWQDGRCTAKLLGLPWERWEGVGIALSADLLRYIPLGSCVLTTLPDGKKEYRIVADVCPLCSVNGSWVDFLEPVQRYDWAAPVYVEEVSPYECNYPAP